MQKVKKAYIKREYNNGTEYVLISIPAGKRIHESCYEMAVEEYAKAKGYTVVRDIKGLNK